ncbi:Oidioi.mRNA.OKI2018_I69.chr1.g716.t1.cds [Oikopleura dioica]|uniref:Oidioi.mRNA.OKI2018_I69.chr1.g716.t1.cds n=1 Tax=Oikopleura dioica TaxID=34765 RepID=A0ABN7SPD8_OIKDI|nr:Oidioi.mRNA.OKI2018_I69.chr1.g716.t1.cds [Oikopleura dioica]
MVAQTAPELQAVIDLNEEISKLVTSLGGTPYSIVVGEDGRVVVPDELKKSDDSNDANNDANDDATDASNIDDSQNKDPQDENVTQQTQ